MYSFPLSSRLITAKDYSFVFNNEPVKFSAKGFVLLAKPNKLNLCRLGLAIAKKQVKLAVKRNLIKRKIRESFRLNNHHLPPCDYVVLIRREINFMAKKDMDMALNQLWFSVDKKLCNNLA